MCVINYTKKAYFKKKEIFFCFLELFFCIISLVTFMPILKVKSNFTFLFPSIFLSILFIHKMQQTVAFIQQIYTYMYT